MTRRTKLSLIAGAAIAAAPGGATAADIALLLGASNPPDNAELLAEALGARGYEVYDRTVLTRADLERALDEVIARLPETDRLILVFTGDARSAGPRTWLLPQDFTGAGRLEATFGAAPLDLLLDMAAERPGRAAVVIGTVPREPRDAVEGFQRLDPGLGATTVPQGVLLIAGPAEPAIDLALRGLLGDAASVAEGLASPAPGLAVSGFLSPEPAFVTAAAAPDAPVDVQPPAERPAPAAAAPPALSLETAEAALDLAQDERRRIQQRLTLLGFDTRGVDGVLGPGTRSAIEAWQRDQALAGAGFLNREQLDLMAALAGARSAELAARAEAARLAAEDADASVWRATGEDGGAADLRAYLLRYPGGIYAGEARASLERIEAQTLAEAPEDDAAAWRAARDADTVAGYRSYIDDLPQGRFADLALARIDALEAAPEQTGAEAATEAALGLGPGDRALIEGLLAAAGFAPGEPDGAFDTTTREALRQFQSGEGLAPTGFIDQPTVQALIAAALGPR